jgi:hypothetical protein
MQRSVEDLEAPPLIAYLVASVSLRRSFQNLNRQLSIAELTTA